MPEKSVFSWLNSIGIILAFIGTFMIAPELLGEERLRRAQRRVRRAAIRVRWQKRRAVRWAMSKAAANRLVRSWLGLPAGAPAATYLRLLRKYGQFVGLFFSGPLASLIELNRLIDALARGDQTLRSVLVQWGIALLVLGFLLQFIGTFTAP